MRIHESAHPVSDGHLALLGHRAQAAGQLADHLVLPGAQLVDVDLRLAEGDAVVGQRAAGLHHRPAACSSALDGMQPTLRQTPPSVAMALDQHDLLAQVGGAKRGGIAARARSPAPRPRMLARPRLAPGAGSENPAGAGCGRCRARGAGGRRRSGPVLAGFRAQQMISVPSDTLSPTLSFSSFTTPAAGEGISIVALSDSTVISDVSFSTASPGLTRTSMTSISLKSPMSGTLISTVRYAWPSRAATGGCPTAPTRDRR